VSEVMSTFAEASESGVSCMPGPPGSSARRRLSRGRARPPTQSVIGYIDVHRSEFGVKPICWVLAATGLAIAPSNYYAAKARMPSARSLATRTSRPRSLACSKPTTESMARKSPGQLNRQGIWVARRTIERLMRQRGLRGAVWGATQRSIGQRIWSSAGSARPRPTGCEWPNNGSAHGVPGAMMRPADLVRPNSPWGSPRWVTR
jgi:hypothetical protein